MRGRDRLANLIPNMMTLGAVWVGLTAVRFALDARIDLAVIALVVAGDGRLGRQAGKSAEFYLAYR